jgi:hypothetical protein
MLRPSDATDVNRLGNVSAPVAPLGTDEPVMRDSRVD